MSRLKQAFVHLQAGEAAILADEHGSGEADLVLAADMAQPATLRALSEAGSQALALVFDSRLADRLGLAGLAADKTPAAWPICAGPSRASLEQQVDLIKAASRGDTSKEELEASGIVPRRVASAGVLARPGRAEAAVDALRLAGRAPVAVLAPLRLPGEMLARYDEPRSCDGFSLFTIQDVVAHRLARETIIEAAVSAQLPSIYADAPLEVQAFRDLLDGSEHLATIRGPLGAEPLVRIHSECLTGDALGSLRCDCGDQLRRSLRLISKNPSGGVVVYLRGQEGRGIGLVNKIRAYALQDLGRDTVEANVELGFPVDLRDYGVAVQILLSLGIRRLRLLSNNPRKASALERYGIKVTQRLPLRIRPNPLNARYLETKRLKMGHDLGAGGAADLDLAV